MVTEARRGNPVSAGRNRPRRPQQKRGVERFEAILDVAHRLLAGRTMSDVSLYDVAREVGCAPATVYHLFPSTGALFYALAGRYAEAWMAMLAEERGNDSARSWQDIVRRKFAEARAFYDDNPQAMEVYLGLGTTREIRARDREVNRQLGAMVATGIRRQFQLPESEFLNEKFVYAIEISDAFWSMSYARHGRITPEIAEETLVAVFSYLENFVPIQLPRIEPATTLVNQ